MSIKFVVRTVEFHHDGEKYVNDTYVDRFYKVCDSLDEAEESVRKFTIKWLKNEDSLSMYEFFSEWSSEINDFCLSRCGAEFSEYEDGSADKFPEELTDQDLLDLAEVIQLKLYIIEEFDDSDLFYVVDMGDNEYFGNLYSKNVDDLVSQVSDDCYSWRITRLFPGEDYSTICLSGSMEELSHNPELLKDFIKNNPEIIKYSEESKELIMKNDDINKVIYLDSLLNNPYINFRKIGFNELVKM